MYESMLSFFLQMRQKSLRIIEILWHQDTRKWKTVFTETFSASPVASIYWMLYSAQFFPRSIMFNSYCSWVLNGIISIDPFFELQIVSALFPCDSGILTPNCLCTFRGNFAKTSLWFFYCVLEGAGVWSDSGKWCENAPMGKFYLKKEIWSGKGIKSMQYNQSYKENSNNNYFVVLLMCQAYFWVLEASSWRRNYDYFCCREEN